ncbi:LysR family transcriptional regulator [Caulobacter mirabilis]|uniref:Transcriptional regulator n=1 Tax=Caulobacter mirabilis TaxID=69666 RepID=A0A2D2AWQ0_9CAUL|nr:LysR family transcriptional regulator [Caulobacter mirabilis]ATQ42405.1 transcriptional regulator [Caulobacter mirabilis]
MDQLTALKVFRRVVELGSFAEAARRLSLSPAAVSKNIGELEAHVSARLLNRTTRRMSLTEAGATYYERIAGVLDDLEDASASLGALHDEASGVLRVSAPLSFTLVGLSSAIPEFLQRYPKLSLDLHLDDRRVDIVRDGYDLAIRGSDALEDSSLVARKLMVMDHVLCASPAYFERVGAPKTPTDLADHNCIRFSHSGHADAWTFARGGRSVRVPVVGRYSVGSSLAVRDALRAGLGVSLIPRLYVREDLDGGRLATALDDWSADETSIFAVYPSRRHMAAKVRVFLSFLVETLEGG